MARTEAPRRSRRRRPRRWLHRSLSALSLVMLLAGLGILTAYGIGFGRGLRVDTTTSRVPLVADPLPTPRPAAAAPAVDPEGVPPGAPLGALPAPATLRIDAIGLDVPVTPAPLVTAGNVRRWQVPDAAAGHGEGTANPGEAGNAVLMGHVQGVFRDLHRLQPGEEIVLVNAAGTRMTYEIVDLKTVTPGEVSVVAPTPDATVTLITCAGRWLPQARDYTERLIVVGKLRSMEAPTL